MSIYSNVLHRAHDQQGLADWLDAMENGMANEQVLVNFSESTENRLQLVGVMQDSVAYTSVIGVA